MDLANPDGPATTTMYFDPVLNTGVSSPARGALTTAFYAAAQEPEDAQRLFAAGITSAQLDRAPRLPLRATRAYAAALLLAREWSMTELAERLSAAIDASYEPTWDAESGEFTWGMGLKEPHPRGQFNAYLAAAEAGGPGRWSALSAQPLASCPQVVDVDFPTLAFTRAEWLNGSLFLTLAPRQEDRTKRTTFRLVGAEPRIWCTSGIDNVTTDVTSNSVIVSVPLVKGTLEFSPGSY